MIHLPKTTIKKWEVIIQADDTDQRNTLTFLDEMRAQRYAHFHNRMRGLGFRSGVALARPVKWDCKPPLTTQP